MLQRKSGCTGAIFPSSRHELKAWQTGGVHVRSFAGPADRDKFSGERLHLEIANWGADPDPTTTDLEAKRPSWRRLHLRTWISRCW
jgi:hypothetical protein